MAASIKEDAVTQSSPLLNLAPEILQMILIEYYNNGSIVITLPLQEPDDNDKPRIVGMPSLDLERTCKCLRKESLAVREKHVTLRLIAEDCLGMVSTMSEYLGSNELNWARERVISIQAAIDLSSWARTRDVEWSSFPWVSPNLKDIELHGIFACTSRSRLQIFKQYMSIDCDESRRKLARNIIRAERFHHFARDWVSTELYPLEEAYHNARHYSNGNNQISIGVPATEVIIRFRVLTQMNYHRKGQDMRIYDLTSRYESKGWNAQASHRGIDLATLSHVCKIDTIEMSYECGVEEHVALPTSE